MLIIGWIVLGLVAGFIASKVVNIRGRGVILDIILGILGAILGGILFTKFGAASGPAGVTGFNIYSMLAAVICAIIVLLIYHLIFGRGRDPAI